MPSPPRPAIETTISEITLALTEIWKDKSGKERTIIKSSGRDTEYWEFFSSAHNHLRGNLWILNSPRKHFIQIFHFLMGIKRYLWGKFSIRVCPFFQAGTDTYCSNLYLFSFLSFPFEKKSLNFEYDTEKCDIWIINQFRGNKLWKEKRPFLENK